MFLEIVPDREGAYFADRHGRTIVMRGINLAGDAKLPAQPFIPSHEPKGFYDGDNVSFVGSPFPLDSLDIHLKRIKAWGFNTVRYIFTWEALEHAGPGKYDDDFIDFTVKVLYKLKEYRLMVIMDPHQDVWSRFSGGSGAPMWTLYAAGFDPRTFNETEAALVQNTYLDPEKFPPMIWATNYARLVSYTMFALFFGGRSFAPKCVINGVNIQDFLEDHYLDAISRLAERIYETGDLENDPVVGWETMNEPTSGFLGIDDLANFPDWQALLKGTCPTPFETMLLGNGCSLDVQCYDFGPFGPYKTGTKTVNRDGISCWIRTDEFDKRYGFERGPNWKLGECIWEAHGVYRRDARELLLPEYFAHTPQGLTISRKHFVDTLFVDHALKYRKFVRGFSDTWLVVIQPPVLELPPDTRSRRIDDDRIAYSPHFYDGLTLINRSWNPIMNVDSIGILRGDYIWKGFGVRLGENNIRRCLRDQLKRLKDEGVEYMGDSIPCILSETGTPMNMDGKQAYKDGNFKSQTRAVDAIHFALEGAKLNHCIWVYCGENSHRYGDLWNGEDLSIWSPDDVKRNNLSQLDYASHSSTPPSPLGKSSTSSFSGLLKSADQTLDGGEVRSMIDGTRARDAFIRPYPHAVIGKILSHGFDLSEKLFTLEVVLSAGEQVSANSTHDQPSIIYIPEYHFPYYDRQVTVSSGVWKFDTSNRQKLMWWPTESGIQTLRVQGTKKNSVADTDEGCNGCFLQ